MGNANQGAEREQRQLLAAFLVGAGAGNGDPQPGPSPAPDPDALEARLRRLVERGSRAWPQLALPAGRFAEHLGRCLAPAAPAVDQLEALAIEELYLACACAEGVPGAAAALDRAYLSRLPELLGRLGLPPFVVDEARQILAVRLLTASPGSTPRIASFRGRGGLRVWLRVAAARIAIDVQRQQVVAGPSQMLQPPTAGSGQRGLLGVEDDYLLRQHGDEFGRALHAAVAALPDEQRELLFLHHVEGLGAEEIARRQGVHRATATRWLAAGREAILDGVRQRLSQRLRLSPSGYQSLLRLLQSHFEISVGAILKAHRPLAGRLPRPDARGRKR